ncbi:hypothetical protein BGZ61DRAFT_47885 [Ilyonectria robusta]|uniref:uncharacterized protein n=1 Tax=Ilyonectria robusta TaxID=1079257 RepID=UPI001E8CF885|nr:uncharacterized protein BGZ61DRAFT_47885 [Ilyonectria robusta]KAH8686913.1 hypothetical protein BGZ61DRAFT_47885 [Ilyonectria robusta]
MRFSIFSVVAASSLAAATYDLPADEGTTTMTSTTTRVITLTACPDSVVDCPYRTTTSTEVVITTSTSEVIPSTTSIYIPPVVNTTTSTTSVYTPIYTPPVVSKSTYYPAGNTTTHGPTAPITHSTLCSVFRPLHRHRCCQRPRCQVWFRRCRRHGRPRCPVLGILTHLEANTRLLSSDDCGSYLIPCRSLELAHYTSVEFSEATCICTVGLVPEDT